VHEDNIKGHLNEIRMRAWTGLKWLEMEFNGDFL
jgi:hypothetical protein